MAAEGLEQLQHARVVGLLAPRPGPGRPRAAGAGRRSGTASGSPRTKPIVISTVHGPQPAIAARARRARAGSRSKAASTWRAPRAAARSVRSRWPSTPARRSSSAGSRSHAEGSSGRRRPGGPGATAPRDETRRRWARAASRNATRCCSTYSVRPSKTQGLRGRRIPRPRRARVAIGPGGHAGPDGSSRSPASASDRSIAHAAPGPQARASTPSDERDEGEGDGPLGSAPRLPEPARRAPTGRVVRDRTARIAGSRRSRRPT